MKMIGPVALLIACLSLSAGAAEPTQPADAAEHTKPLFRDFIGINGHTISFKPELYRKVCRLVRDYHPLDWDTGSDTDYKLDFPSARNRVNWEQVYGAWKQAGFATDACIMFETVAPNQWKDLDRDANRYGRRFAESFGPHSSLANVDSVEIGNEPGKYSDEDYRRLFTSMATGIRAGDAAMKIATCNVNVGPSGDYHKSVECIAGLDSLYDVLSIHSYAMLKQWPTWERSFPEDDRLPTFMQDIEKLIQWRDQHVPGKQVWVTEFGWDASTKQPSSEGDFAKWQGNTDLQQAQWLVRSFFLFATRDIDRAYIYFFNDSDEPKLHAASGLTRNYEPKSSFYAVSHLYQTLGDYRYSRVVVSRAEDVCVQEFVHGDDSSKRIWAIWSPTGNKRTGTVELPIGSASIVRVEKMPTTAEPAAMVDVQQRPGFVSLSFDETPTYLTMQD